MKMTPQLYLAAGAVFLVLLITIGPLLAGGVTYPIPITEQRVAPTKGDLEKIPAERALEPLQADQSGPPLSNPFTLRASANSRNLLPIPLPPAPPLELPPPPALPVPEK